MSALIKIKPRERQNYKWFSVKTRRNPVESSRVAPGCSHGISYGWWDQLLSILAHQKYQLSYRHRFFTDLWFLSLCGSCRWSLWFFVLALSLVFLFHVTISYPKVKCSIGETCPTANPSCSSTVVILPSNTLLLYQAFPFILIVCYCTHICHWFCTIVLSVLWPVFCKTHVIFQLQLDERWKAIRFIIWPEDNCV